MFWYCILWLGKAKYMRDENSVIFLAEIGPSNCLKYLEVERCNSLKISAGS